MADFGAPVAQSVDVSPSKGFETIGSLMGLTAKRQALAGQAADVQQKQQDASQRAAMAKIDWAKHTGQDGTLDVDSFNKDQGIRQAAGDFYPDILAKAAQIKQSQVGAKQSLLKLNGDQLSNLGSVVGGLKTDPDVMADTPAGRQKMTNAFAQFGQTYGPDAARVAQIYGPMVEHAPKGKLSQAIQTLQLQTQDVGRQIAETSPQASTIDTGGMIQPGATASPLSATPGAFTPAGKPIAKTFAPQVITSPTTGGAYKLGPGGTATPVTAPGGGGAADFQNPNYQGQGKDVATFQDEVQNVRQEAQQAPLARNINAQILRLSGDAKTGPGSDVWQHVIGAVGAPFGLSPSASYQEVGKFLEKNAINNMTAMGGPPSDSRLDAAAKANGSTSFSPEALKAVTKFNDATTTALDQYRQGVDHAVGMGQNVDYTKLPAFKAAWAKNFDVDVFRVENAIRDGDKPELAKIKKELGPEKLKALAEKRRNLVKLMQTGQP